MIFTVSFEITDESATLGELTSAGFTIAQAEELVKRGVIEAIEDEFDESMTLSNIIVKYKEENNNETN